MSEAIISPPVYNDILKLKQEVNSLILISDSTQLAELKSLIDYKKLFSEFNISFNSDDVKEEFIYLNFKKDLDNKQTEDEKLKLIAKISEDISSVKQKDSNLYNLTFTSNGAKRSQKLLSNYIGFVNKKINDENLTTLKNIVTSLINNNNEEKNLLLVKAKERVSKELVLTEGALTIAKKSQITNPILQYNSDIFDIQKGSKALLEKKLILDNFKDYSVFEPKISILEHNYNILKKIDVNEISTSKYYSFIEKPTNPIKQKGTPGLYIIIFGFIFGICAGVLYVLLISSNQDESKEEQ